MHNVRRLVIGMSIVILGCGETAPPPTSSTFAPTAVIDLGALVTADLPERVWGPAFLAQNGFTDPNSFDVISWTFPAGDEEVQGSNAYYRLFNHGGPHIDAPNHVGVGGGLDTYPVEAFSGPLKVVDARGFGAGRTVPESAFEGVVDAGDVVILLTNYTPPVGDDIPSVTTLTNEAADFLASLPIRALGTNSFSTETPSDFTKPWIHDYFLGAGIPIYEQLFNVEVLLGYDRLFFTGAPLNVKDGDGMVVRPLAFAY